MATRKDAGINPKYALSAGEIDFCKKYAALGYKKSAEAYRRAFMKKNAEGGYVDPPQEKMTNEELNNLEPLTARQIDKKSQTLLLQDRIIGYLDSLSNKAGDVAYRVFHEQALFGEDSEAMRAADHLLKLEDQHALRDDFEKWAEVMCSIGTEVVVPLEGGTEVVFPLRAMFPDYQDALPDEDTITRTIKALEDYKARYHTDDNS